MPASKEPQRPMQSSSLSEKEFLRHYDSKNYEQPITSIDTVIFTVRNKALHVLLVKRSDHPFMGQWSLVGGFINLQTDTHLEDSAKRKLAEKTGIETPYLEQFGTIGNSTRDPRGWSVTTVYFALIPHDENSLRTGPGTDEIKWVPIDDNQTINTLAFDHTEILTLCIDRLRSKVLYTSLPIHLMSKEFTLSELQHVYEMIIDKKIDPKSFRRRILGANILEKTEKLNREGTRPAYLYRQAQINHTHYFLRNIEGAAY
jgi:8-oxo-dGTP diphosphatase